MSLIVRAMKMPRTISLMIQELLFIQSRALGRNASPRRPNASTISAGRRHEQQGQGEKAEVVVEGVVVGPQVGADGNGDEEITGKDAEQGRAEAEGEARLGALQLLHPLWRLRDLAVDE